MLENLVSFTILAGLLTLLPGLDTAQVLRSVAIGGRSTGYATLFGILGGVWIWGVSAALGISALLIASEIAYTIVKWMGAIYLVYLGVKMWLDSKHITTETIAEKSEQKRTFAKTFFRALFITLSNPKNGVFYVAVLPQFLPDQVPAVVGGFLLATIHNALTFTWFSLLILGAGFAKQTLKNPKVQKVVERVSGIALIGFGVRIALEKTAA
ncbi:MAG: Leucine efflux protein [Actinomycetota bacterium]